MKKSIKFILALTVLVLSFTGCGSSSGAPSKWYEGTINYYKEGFENNWANESSDFYVVDEMKQPGKKFGYLLIDLDGDGTEELLIGINDGAEETKFTDLIIWHKDFGAFRSFCASEDYYIYICDNNIVRMDMWYGSQTKSEYMEYDSSNNSFPVVDGGGKPGKFELTPLN